MNQNSEFEKAFSDLKKMGNIVPSAKKTFELLKELNSESIDLQSDTLITEFNKIQYHSNTYSYFYFYFPIVTHILYYKPKYEKGILKYLIAPNFANGILESDQLILMITEAMKFKLDEDKYYLTTESQFWVTSELPKLKEQIQREINVCWKELNE
ncbi:hypothetical protein B0A62_00015 [Flavobacterium hydatis]|uniref:Uncharacterized protein n=1 Tax=Flavobacterium hydatis TaxID=991 RepID=A0A086AFA8_FLAHY|nr:hypothetical protein IW20_14630 [Flavobacterium hydatis]OXA98531.1 hypothetical protein B0A62_00015 [Flavobacterium hydatis]